MGVVKIDENVDPMSLRVNSSLTTIFSLVNSMIGGTMLLLPALFKSCGIVVSEIILIISGFISYKTVDMYSVHMKDKEFDI